MKVVGEREILASLVEFKHHSMAETIRNKKEEKKTKAEVPDLTKKDKKAPKFKPPYLRNHCRGGAETFLRRYGGFKFGHSLSHRMMFEFN